MLLPWENLAQSEHWYTCQRDQLQSGRNACKKFARCEPATHPLWDALVLLCSARCWIQLILLCLFAVQKLDLAALGGARVLLFFSAR